MAAVTKSDAARVLPILKMRVGVAVAGAGFRELTGASLVDHTSGSRSTSQVPTFRGPGAVSGAKSVENVTFDLAAVQPHIAVMDDLRRADSQRLNVRVRMDIYSRVIRDPAAAPTVQVAIPTAGNIQAIADGGKLTITGSPNEAITPLFENDEILVGDILHFGEINNPGAGDAYIINTIKVDDDTGKLDGAGTGVWVTNADGSDAMAKAAAPQAGFRTAGWRQEFADSVNQLGSIQGDASGSPSLSSGVVFTPHALLPSPIILFGKQGDDEAAMGAPVW